MEIIIDYNKFHDYICGFVDPYEIPAVENAVNKAVKRDLVRCGECKYRDETRYCSEVEFRTTPDWFCADGERRIDE